MGRTEKEIFFDAEAEEMLLGLIFTDDRVWEKASELPLDYFYGRQNRKLFKEFLRRYNEELPIDISIIPEIDGINIEKIIQATELYAGYYSKLDEIIQRLSEMYRKRNLTKLFKSAVLRLEKEDSDAVLHDIEDEIEVLGAGKSNTLFSLDELIDRYGNEESFNDMSKSFVQTGFVDVDKSLIIKRGDFIILAGRPSMGKTALTLAMAKNIARAGRKVGIFSLEMRAQYLLKRLAQSEGHQYHGVHSFLQGVKQLVGLPLWIDEKPNYHVYALRNRIKYMKKRLGIEIIFLDYLTLLDPPKADSRVMEVTAISRELKHLARIFDIPMIVLSQLSRAVEARRSKVPMLSDLRDSGAIEQDADAILFTYRPFKYGIVKHPATGESTKNYMQLILAKQRDGQTGIFELFYDENTQFFADWAKGYSQDLEF